MSSFKILTILRKKVGVKVKIESGVSGRIIERRNYDYYDSHTHIHSEFLIEICEKCTKKYAYYVVVCAESWKFA